MADILLYLAYAVLAFCGAAIGGFVFQVLLSASMHARITSLENTIKGRAGQAAQSEKSERMIEAATEAFALHKDGKDIKTILATVGMKYPDVAADFAKKALKGKIPGLDLIK